MASINDSTPRMEHLGTKDEGGRQVYPQPKEEKLWNPKVYSFASKGDSKNSYEVTGDEFKVIFGEATLDPRGKFFNHQLFMANKIFKSGGSIVFQKLDVPETPGKDAVTAVAAVPEDGDTPAPPAVLAAPAVDAIPGSKTAGITIYAMVAPKADLKRFKRDAGGKIVRPLVEETAVDGFEVVFVASDRVVNPVAKEGGKINNVNSTIYPLFTIESIGENEVYNKYAFTMDALTGGSNDTKILEERKALQVALGIISKETGAIKKIGNTLGLNEVFCTFKEYVVDPTTNRGISIDDVFPKSWENITNVKLPLTAAPFKDVIVHEGLATFTKVLSEKEATFVEAEPALKPKYTGYGEDWEALDRSNIFNWISFKDAANDNEYITSTIAAGPTVDFTGALDKTLKPKALDISDKTPIYLRGGADGAVDNLEVYEKALLVKVAEYADRDAKVQSIPLNRENIFVDTGFSLNTSLKLPMIQYHRADIELILSTYEFDKKDKDGENTSRDITSAALLRNAISLTPESKEYNTPTSRGVIVQGCGKDTDEIYPYLLPNTIELAHQSALYMGGTSWNGRYKFGGQPGSLFSALTDIRPADLKFSVKSKLHNTGVMYAEVEDRGNWFFPTYAGVYSDATSPLVSYHTNIALTYFVKLHHRMWRKYTGRKDLSEGELKDLIESDMRDSLSLEKFNNEFKALIPEVYFLEFDRAKGHIWRQRIYTYSENERSVMLSDNVVRRASDLTGGN